VTLPENAPSVDLFALIDRLADEMDKEFIIDPQVARVPGLSTAGADADYDTLLALLRNAQYAAIESGDQIRIVPEVTARSEPTPIVNEDDSRISDHTVVTRIIDVSGIEVNLPDGAPEEARSIGPQLVPVLRPLMSTAIGNMAIVTGTNKVILTDRYDNIRRITAIIDALR
jgi:general secretion pathway protein D